jgi:hypothetical protein
VLIPAADLVTQATLNTTSMCISTAGATAAKQSTWHAAPSSRTTCASSGCDPLHGTVPTLASWLHQELDMPAVFTLAMITGHTTAHTQELLCLCRSGTQIRQRVATCWR